MTHRAHARTLVTPEERARLLQSQNIITTTQILIKQFKPVTDPALVAHWSFAVAAVDV